MVGCLSIDVPQMSYTGIVYQHPAFHIQVHDGYRSMRVNSAVAQDTLLLIEHVIRAPVDVLGTVLSHDVKLFDALFPRGVGGETLSRDEQCIQKIQRNAFKDSDSSMLVLGQTISCINHRCDFNAAVVQQNVEGGGVFACVYATKSLDQDSEVFIMYGKGAGHGEWDFACPCGMTDTERECIRPASAPVCPAARTYIRDYFSTMQFKQSLLFQTMALHGLYWCDEQDTWHMTPRYQSYIRESFPGLDIETAIRLHVGMCIDIIES